eukprot:1724272-Pyramimonas_sp.AAC.1
MLVDVRGCKWMLEGCIGLTALVYLGSVPRSPREMSETTRCFLYDATVMALRAIAGAVIACAG